MDYKPNDWVVVKSPCEIAQTLDAEGALDGLPFMPEMLEHCGKRLKVLRLAEKTCVEMPNGVYAIREFVNNDVFLLDGFRCSGASHDGCQRACMFFWKAAWLSTGAERQLPAPTPEELAILSGRLKTKTSADRYFCQSSQLAASTVPRRLGKLELFAKCWRDVRSGAVAAGDMLLLVLFPLYRKIRDALVGRPRLRGELTKTPVGHLNLQPGECVQIRDLEEVRRTLDTKGRNRGLVFDIELKKFCGKKYRVRNRLDQMISEPTGLMRKVEGTVILEGNNCMCARSLGGCPRLEYSYWREVWLRRIEPDSAGTTQ
jgi:hypothetical protein